MNIVTQMRKQRCGMIQTKVGAPLVNLNRTAKTQISVLQRFTVHSALFTFVRALILNFGGVVLL